MRKWEMTEELMNWAAGIEDGVDLMAGRATKPIAQTIGDPKIILAFEGAVSLISGMSSQFSIAPAVISELERAAERARQMIAQQQTVNKI